MRYLLDTHILLWLLAEPEKLSLAAGQVIASVENEIVVSNASLWEIAIKYQRGKLPLPMPPAKLFPQFLQEAELKELPVSSSHALRVADLPLVHRDPFDRMLIAQAMAEEMTVITVDPVFAQYDIAVFPGGKR